MFIYLSDSAGSFFRDSVSFFTGNPTQLFLDSANSPQSWSTGIGWDTTTDFENGSLVFTDSPVGKYSSNAENSLTLLSPIDLSEYHFAELKFKTKWSIEPTWDFGIVEISTDSGATWNALRSKLSRKASGRAGSKQPLSVFGYDGYSPRSSWIDQSIDISSFTGNKILLRFRLSSDVGEERDGWYIDDITVLGYHSEPSNVEEQSLPYPFALKQNYPNPFNPSTQIGFSIPENSNVNLSVYDILGKNIAVIVNQHLEKGTHTVNFNARQLSTGIYFYRLTAGSYSAVKRMTILK
jgi:hypothetical protein